MSVNSELTCALSLHIVPTLMATTTVNVGLGGQVMGLYVKILMSAMRILILAIIMLIVPILTEVLTVSALTDSMAVAPIVLISTSVTNLCTTAKWTLVSVIISRDHLSANVMMDTPVRVKLALISMNAKVVIISVTRMPSVSISQELMG